MTILPFVLVLTALLSGELSAQSKLSDFVESFESNVSFHTGKRQLRNVYDTSKWQTAPEMENSMGRMEKAKLSTKLGSLEYTDATYTNPDVPAASPYSQQQGLFRLKYDSPTLNLKSFKLAGVDLQILSKLQMDQIVWNRKFLGSFDKEVDPALLPAGTVIYEKYRTLNPTVLVVAPKIPLIPHVEGAASVGIIPVGMVNLRRKDEDRHMFLKKDNVFSGLSLGAAIAYRDGKKTYLRFFYEQVEQISIANPEKKLTSSEITLGCEYQRQLSPRAAIGLTASVNEILQRYYVAGVDEGNIVKTQAVGVTFKYKVGSR